MKKGEAKPSTTLGRERFQFPFGAACGEDAREKDGAPYPSPFSPISLSRRLSGRFTDRPERLPASQAATEPSQPVSQG